LEITMHLVKRASYCQMVFGFHVFPSTDPYMHLLQLQIVLCGFI
jgi:hypothetical protein